MDNERTKERNYQVDKNWVSKEKWFRFIWGKAHRNVRNIQKIEGWNQREREGGRERGGRESRAREIERDGNGQKERKREIARERERERERETKRKSYMR